LIAALIIVILGMLLLTYLRDPGVTSLANILAYLIPATLIIYFYLLVSRR
jgi:hypothetical protein